MSTETLRDRLTRQLDEWGYDFSGFQITDFIAWVEARRGRPIRIVPTALPPDMFGAWIQGDTADYVFYDEGTIGVHTVHILLHELCHMLLGHQTAHVARAFARPQELNDRGFPAGNQQSLQGLFRQVQKDDEQEVEAETLSSLIQHRVFRLAGLSALTSASTNQDLRQVVTSLGFDR